MAEDRFGARAQLGDGLSYQRLAALEEAGVGAVSRLPVTVKILLENLLRHAGDRFVTDDDVAALARWDGRAPEHDKERAFVPARVLLQDFTGVPAVVDLAAMRSAVQRSGGDPRRIDPLVPVDLVVDHSVQVDAFGSRDAYRRNIEREYERNHERYTLLRWAQQAFRGFRVVPPGMGIVHQVNLEHLAETVTVRELEGARTAVPDTVVGTDSHTPMVNGVGVLGWGVGGIEAEACMLGQPLFLLTPVVVGVRFHNALPPGSTATDLVLTLTEILRRHGVVNKFVEFCGSGLSSMSVPDRATLSNMSPEFGATASLFPVDDRTLGYLRDTGRSAEHVEMVERYCKEQGLFRTDQSATPVFSELLELDLATVEPSVAGPRRPQDRVPLGAVWESFEAVHGAHRSDGNGGKDDLSRLVAGGGNPERTPGNPHPGEPGEAFAAPPRGALRGLDNGSVVIAAITSCTNTSNPSVMVGAGLLARNAVERGLRPPAHVKTSLAPGSRVVTGYLERAGLLGPLDELGFNLVGYGCTTCIGNSGPLPVAVAAEVESRDLAVCAVLSGNRNFEGRIHPQVRASYLASPPLVVAFGLAGTVDIDLTRDPIGTGSDGRPVYLREIWPSPEEVREAVARSLGRDLFDREYSRIFEGDEHWRELPSPAGAMFEWDPDSTYVREPPFFQGMEAEPAPPRDIEGARVLALLGDSITTDHISPAGSISLSSAAAAYLREHAVEPRDFNTYGARRGNHEVMVRGTFANIRLRNRLAGDREGGFTTYLGPGAAPGTGDSASEPGSGDTPATAGPPAGPDEVMSIYDAAMRYAAQGTPLIIIAGREYGSGSSRDWAAKGPYLQGVRAVIAQSFERIHRSNLVGMGILPLQFREGESAESLGIDGRESCTISGIAGVRPGGTLPVTARRENGLEVRFEVTVRLDSETDLEYHRHGGILQMVLRQLTAG
ncbi:MAG TPA: aconitate hydratase AcnA [Candidatus Binatia bacterium]|nr:aconitate hydratase AcnA [Candidatus Binatia bacterium]